MNHIKTISDEEISAKKEYAELKSNVSITADAQIEQIAYKLRDMMLDADKKELEMSRLRGILMKAMGGNAYLIGHEGKALCSWVSGSKKITTDWKGICSKYKVSDEDIASFTKTSIGARRFSVDLV